MELMQGFNPKTRKGGDRTMSGWDENPFPDHPVTPRNRMKKKIKAKRRKSKWGGGAVSIGGATAG